MSTMDGFPLKRYHNDRNVHIQNILFFYYILSIKSNVYSLVLVQSDTFTIYYNEIKQMGAREALLEQIQRTY